MAVIAIIAREGERESAQERIHLKGRDGGRSRANCGLDSINEGGPGSEHSVPFSRTVRASFRRPWRFSAIFQEVREQNGTVGADRRESKNEEQV